MVTCQILNKIKKKLTATNVEAVKVNPPGNVEEFLVKFCHIVAPAYMIRGVGVGKAKTATNVKSRLAGTTEDSPNVKVAGQVRPRQTLRELHILKFPKFQALQ